MAFEPKRKVKPTPKTPPKKEAIEKTIVFPITSKINDYGFIHVNKGLLQALGWRKGMPLSIEKNADNSVTLRERKV